MTACNARVALDGSECEAPPEAQPSGPVDPRERIEVSVMIRPRRPLAQLEALLNQPGSAVLSREAYAAGFGADTAEVAKVAAFAGRHGLEIVEASPSRRTVRLAGGAAEIRSAFGIQLMQYVGFDGRAFRGYTGPIQLPADLDGVVQAVFGLDNRPVARRR